MAIPPVDSQILASLELLHYCKRFQNSLFAFVFRKPEDCAQVVMDLRVLQAAQIRQVIFAPYDQKLVEALETWNRSGDRFAIYECSLGDVGSVAFIESLSAKLNSGCSPVIAIKEMPLDRPAVTALHGDIIASIIDLGCKKVFFPGSESGLRINGHFRSYPTIAQLKEDLNGGAEFNIPPQEVAFICEQQELHGIDFVLVKARRGAIFEEVFTHAGSGTLFTAEYPNILRMAHEGDVRDIMAIMHPYIVEGALTPVAEEELLQMIRCFMVYSVNGVIVCAAALKHFGDLCELAKLCTLPRFQARGRARELVLALVNKARELGKSGIFALTVQSYVGEFFERLGFKEVSRESLPEEWLKAYDLSRPSRAFMMQLN